MAMSAASTVYKRQVLPVFKEKHTEDSEKIIAEKAAFSKKVSGAE